MAPHDQLQKRIAELIRNGCTPDQADEIASQEFNNSADRADALLDLKQQSQWNQRHGGRN
jgi:hypothetical protein